MAVYNGQTYVKQAIESILVQTFTDFEFLIVDDASTDATADLLASLTDPRVRVYTNAHNLGLTRSLNRGLSLARGVYIARQDADDLSLPERLARQVTFLDQQPEIVGIGTTTEWIDAAGAPQMVWRQPTQPLDIQTTLLRYCCVIHGSMMYRRQAVLELGGYTPTMRTAQDYDLWLRLAEVWDLACLPEVLYRYRWHDQMASVTRKPEQDSLAQAGRQAALRRRLNNVWRLGQPTAGVTKSSVWTRRQRSERYTAWSAGARESHRGIALAYLVAAFLLDPTYPPLWQYLQGIAKRKLQRLVGHVSGHA